MEKKTYGAPRYMDWVAQIKAGTATVKVHFTGGALTVYGVTPAEYTTTNPFIQKVIEQSRYFKERRIVLLNSIDIGSDPGRNTERRAKREKRESSSAKPQVEPKPIAAPSEEATKGNENPIETTDSESIRTENVDDISSGPDLLTEDDPTAETDGLTPVEVSDLADAQGYLQEKFEIASYKVRSYISAQKMAKNHGIMFVGKGFSPITENQVTESLDAEQQKQD